MPTSVGPNTFGEENLVFGYDLGDVSNSYKGEPTINYAPTNFGSWGTENTAQRIATGNTYQGQPTYNCTTTVGVSWQGIDTTIAGLRTAAGSSGTVTMSCMVRNNNTSSYPMYAYIGHDFSSTRNIPANSGWQKVQWTVNQSSMNNDYVEFRPYTNNANIYLEMTMPMVEVNKGHATPFTTGTRSATQGLIDLKGTSTIDLTNVSFDSNAQMTFDGTNDYVSLGDNSAWDFGQNGTLEMVVRPTNSTGNDRLWCIDNNSSNLDAYLNSSGYNVYMHGGVVGTTTPLTQNQYNHLVVVYNGGTIQIYVNGAVGTMTGTTTGYNITNPSANNSNLYLGCYRDLGYNLYGDINLFKVYNRALTASEVASNYNAIKSRFLI